LDNKDNIFSFSDQPGNASDENGFGEEDVLSFDRLREAFAELNKKETDATSDFAQNNESQNRLSNDSQASTECPNAEFASHETLTKSDNATDNEFTDNEFNEDVDTETEDDTKDAAESNTGTEFYETISISEEERCEVNPRTIFEAMLFVGDRENKPLMPESAAELMRNVSPEELTEIVNRLNAEYESYGTPYHIIRENGGFRMVLRPAYESVRTKFYGKVRESRLSQTAIDVLAVVAYKQPITADDVQKIRKTSSQSILQQLVRRGLVESQRIIRDKKSVVFFRTTDRFLQLFQLESLDDLPTVEEIDFR
jgi:segregation and condensation protein B